MSFTNQEDKDNYATDKKGWELIKNFIPKDKVIWAPFYCDGKQKEYFEEMGFDIIHEDEDFFENNKGDIVVDNPPFSIFNKCCERLKELDKPFILVGFARVLLMKWFQKLFKDDLQVIIPFTRITFTHLIHPKKGYTPPFGTYYFCWKMNLPKDLIFLD
jgi:adenine specific DNA methylase Mod